MTKHFPVEIYPVQMAISGHGEPLIFQPYFAARCSNFGPYCRNTKEDAIEAVLENIRSNATRADLPSILQTDAAPDETIYVPLEALKDSVWNILDITDLN